VNVLTDIFEHFRDLCQQAHLPDFIRRHKARKNAKDSLSRFSTVSPGVSNSSSCRISFLIRRILANPQTIIINDIREIMSHRLFHRTTSRFNLFLEKEKEIFVDIAYFLLFAITFYCYMKFLMDSEFLFFTEVSILQSKFKIRFAKQSYLINPRIHKVIFRYETSLARMFSYYIYEQVQQF